MSNYNPQDTPEQLWQDFAVLQGARSLFETQWEEISRLVLPPFAGSWYGAPNQPGKKNAQQQIDSTASASLARFVTIILGLIVPQNSRWHSLEGYNAPQEDDGYGNYDPQRNRQVKLWLEGTVDRLFHYR